MQTKGRRRKAIIRAHELHAQIALNEGTGPGFLRDSLGFTPGHWLTAIRYLLEDGLVKQVGKRRGAKYYTCAEIGPMRLPTESKPLTVMQPESKPCTFCDISDVEPFEIYGADHVEENCLTAIRQTFHLCMRCANVRHPSTTVASRHTKDVDWLRNHERWQNPDIGVELTIKFEGWVYGMSDEGTTQLFGVVTLPENDQYNHMYYIQFTFDNDEGNTTYARGYRYLHKLYSHPDHLVGKKLVVSRERHKKINRGSSWFWSWTPWPRIPFHLRNKARADGDADATTILDGPEGPKRDVSVPEHHIHSIQDHGSYTIIRVNKNVGDKHNRTQELENLIARFLLGKATMIDLQDALPDVIEYIAEE